MFHMKQIIKLLIFELIFLKFCFSNDFKSFDETNYDKFLREYNFSIFFGNREVGYVNIRISSFVINSETGDVKLYSEINSYTEIPILFFLGNTKNYEIEEYDRNFTPLNSTLITLENEQEETTTTTEVKPLNDDYYECIFKKIKRNSRTKKIKFKPPVLTAGNAIPLVSTLWDFEQVKEMEFYFLDKERFVLDKMKFSYEGKLDNGLNKIRLTLPYFKIKFTIYVDEDKNIVYAEGLGLRIYSK